MQRKRVQDLLGGLKRAKKLTGDGRDWLMLALDPFHDESLQVAGYPDVDSSATIVSCIQYQYEVAKPAAAAANWDCNIFTTPKRIPNVDSYMSFPAGHRSLLSLVDNEFTTGFFNIAKADAGQPLFPSGAAFNPTNFSITTTAATGAPDEVWARKSRIISAGFEVVNTTATLNKQGSVTVYRIPQRPTLGDNSYINGGETNQGKIQTRWCTSPPTTLSDVSFYHGTRTWDAAQGCYVTCGLNTIDVPMTQSTPFATVFSRTSAGEAGYGTCEAPYLVTAAASDAGAKKVTVYDPALQSLNCFDTHGAYFSGLSNTSTLSVRVRIFVESAPTYAEPTLVTLASPSATYDPVALQIYAHVMATVPVGVPVSENAAGDWWRRVLSAVGDIAAPIGMGLNMLMPGAGAIGGGLSLAAKTIASAIPKTDKPQKNKQQPPRQSNGRTVVVVPGSSNMKKPGKVGK